MANPTSVSPSWLEWANSMQAAGYAEPAVSPAAPPPAPSAAPASVPGRRNVNEVSGEQTSVGADGLSYQVDQKRKGLEVVGKTTTSSNPLGSYTKTGASRDNTTTIKDGKANAGAGGLSASAGEYSSGRSRQEASSSITTGLGSYDKKGGATDGKTRVENASGKLDRGGLDLKAGKLKSGQTTTGGTTNLELSNGLKMQQGGASTSKASTAEGVAVKLGKSGKLKADDITMGGQKSTGATTTMEKGDKKFTSTGKTVDTQTHLKGAKAGYDLTDGVNAKLDEGNAGGSRTTAGKVEGKMGDNEFKTGGATTDTRTNVKGASGKLGKTGASAGVDSLEFSGKTVTGVDDSVRVGDFTGSRKVGSEDSKTRIEKAKGKVGKDGVSAEVGRLEGGGTTKLDQNYQAGLGDTAKGNLHIGKDDSKTTLTGAKGKLGPSGGAAEFTEFKKGRRVEDVSGGAQLGSAAGGKGSLGSYEKGQTAKGGKMTVGKDGASAELAEFRDTKAHIENVQGEANLAGATGKGKAGQIVAKETVLKGAKGGIDKKGAKAELAEASYTTAGVKDAEGELDLGKGNKVSAGVGEGKFKSGSVKGAKAGLDKKGASAGIEGAEGSYLDAKNVKADANFLGGAVQGGGSADRVSVIKGSVGKTDAKVGKQGAAVGMKDATFEGFGTTNAKAGIGGSQNRMGGGVDELSMNKVRVGEVKAKAGLGGVAGGAKDMNYSMVDAKGAKAGLKVGGQDIVGAKGDVKQDMGADAVGGGVDVKKGEAGFAAKNARAGMGLKNTSVKVGNREVKLPDAGVEARMSTEAKVGVGKAKAGLDLSGTGVNVAGKDLKLGKWAQVGSDVDVRKGNLDLNIGGQKVDVDEGVRKAGKAAGKAGKVAGKAVGKAGEAAGKSVVSAGKAGVDAASSAAAATADKAKAAAKAAQGAATTAAKEAKAAAGKSLELAAKAKASALAAAKSVGKIGAEAAMQAAAKAKEAAKAGQAVATEAATKAKAAAQAAQAKVSQAAAAAAKAASAAAAAAKAAAAAAAKPLAAAASAAKSVGGAAKSVGSAAKKMFKW